MNAAAPWLLPTNGRITVTVKPGIGAYTRFRRLPAVPWLHVRNQKKRFAREHFAFAREEKRFAREHFTFAREEKRFAREHFTFAREEKRFAREHFAFAREEKRFAREHFAFAREEKRFAREHFAFAREEKRFAREHFTFAREEKRFARKHFAFAREQKRFPRCRRSGVVFPRSVHPPSDPAWPSATVPRPSHSKRNNFLNSFRKDEFLDPSRAYHG